MDFRKRMGRLFCLSKASGKHFRIGVATPIGSLLSRSNRRISIKIFGRNFFENPLNGWKCVWVWTRITADIELQAWINCLTLGRVHEPDDTRTKNHFVNDHNYKFKEISLYFEFNTPYFACGSNFYLWNVSICLCLCVFVRLCAYSYHCRQRAQVTAANCSRKCCSVHTHIFGMKNSFIVCHLDKYE